MLSKIVSQHERHETLANTSRTIPLEHGWTEERFQYSPWRSSLKFAEVLGSAKHDHQKCSSIGEKIMRVNGGHKAVVHYAEPFLSWLMRPVVCLGYPTDKEHLEFFEIRGVLRLQHIILPLSFWIVYALLRSMMTWNPPQCVPEP
ncbi:hypothetical protein NPIL_383541 [Nephila pilipes]|uniref:Uncharacterized protein n=1 Tax=Nephila pilipes TaxID=299642 RepID=A0A8X6TS08_NEPPI|nr:hypothetical protein NPIL_383541 [Nephila pilipes]